MKIQQFVLCTLWFPFYTFSCLQNGFGTILLPKLGRNLQLSVNKSDRGRAKRDTRDHCFLSALWSTDRQTSTDFTTDTIAPFIMSSKVLEWENSAVKMTQRATPALKFKLRPLHVKYHVNKVLLLPKRWGGERSSALGAPQWERMQQLIHRYASVAAELLIWKASDLCRVANKTGSAEGRGDTSKWDWDQSTLESGNGMTYSLIFLPIGGPALKAWCVFKGWMTSPKFPDD